MSAREEAITKIVAERDFLYDLLLRLAKATVCLQGPHVSTTTVPSRQPIYCFAVTDDDHRRIQDFLLHHALGRAPTPTALPAIDCVAAAPPDATKSIT